MSETNQSAKHKHTEKPLPVNPPAPVPEIGGQKGPEPTRYGDWEKNGRVSDF
jgi:hypothetical protein